MSTKSRPSASVGRTASPTYYRRHLPHYQPPGATLFVTFRLAGSLPETVIEQLRREREQAEQLLAKTKDQRDRKRLVREHRWAYFERFDALLDGDTTGPLWLKEPVVAETVKEALHYRDGKVYDLLAYCIMANHVHMVFVGRNDIPAYRILQSLKRHTAREANILLNRTGTFWQDESYDHVAREDELQRIIWYVLLNPVKAGLVKAWQDWRWTYCKMEP